MKTIKINRKEWYRPGASFKNPISPNTYLQGEGNCTCIVGHLYRRFTKHKKLPADAQCVYDLVQRRFNESDITFVRNLWLANDTIHGGDENRENRINELLAIKGIKVIFYG